MAIINIIKLGGSMVNPDGKYDKKVIQEFINLVKGRKNEKFIFVVGGGKLCRYIQGASTEFLKKALVSNNLIEMANDRLGIAITQINADYVLRKFKEKLGSKVYPEILIDPTEKIKSNCSVYFIGGWKPGCSTDKDMMLLAKTFSAEKVFKTSDFAAVKRISLKELSKYSEEDRKKVLKSAESISEMTWQEMKNLVGNKWHPGLNVPFDPEAVNIGLESKRITLYMGKTNEIKRMLNEKSSGKLNGNKFVGTIVRG